MSMELDYSLSEFQQGSSCTAADGVSAEPIAAEFFALGSLGDSAQRAPQPSAAKVRQTVVWC